MIDKTLLLSQFSSDSFKLYTRYNSHTGYHFFFWGGGGGEISATNLKKIYGILKFFLTQDHADAAGNFQSAIFLPQFSLESIKTLCEHCLSW